MEKEKLFAKICKREENMAALLCVAELIIGLVLLLLPMR